MTIRKVLFFDLDGTLCPNHDLVPAPGIVPIFHSFKDRGILPVIATGRSLYEVKPLLEQLQVQSYILANGCYIVYQGRVLQDTQFPVATIEELLALAKVHHHDVGFFNQQRCAVTGFNQRTRAHIDQMQLDPCEIDPLFYQHNHTNFLNIYVDSDQEDLYTQAFKDKLEIVRYAPFAVDVLPEQVSKAHGIDRLLAEHDLLHVPTYAFGDQNNDLSMFARVDHGIAMAVATPELKQLASYVATSEFGVVEGLKHYQLID
ncbi:MAG: Cof-type HAD-IIB family hydrolase [Lactobacillus sp.]|jgi:Cof subfamily protein (haloacid dehalogenase superfamily)|nr:Cof-type HAD-IIB family hydrolase [Lactobacillus sp.]